MNRFITTAISLVLIVAVLPLADISQGGGEPVYAASVGVTGPELPDVVNQSSDISPYDGTYSGTFNYEYRENRLEKVPGREYSEFVEGEWKTGSFTLTVTLEDLAGSYGAETISLVTSVYCSDPNFGTGPSAITPAPNSAARLPADPPTTLMNPSGPYMGIQIFFPNGAELHTVTPSTAASGGDLSVSLTGQTLSGSTWMAFTPSGPFSNIDLSYPLRQYQYNMKGKSWSLTKVPNQGSVPIMNTDSFDLKLDLSAIYGNIEARQQELKSARTASIDRIKEIDEKLSNIKPGPISPLEQLERQALDFQIEQNYKNNEKKFTDALLDIITPDIPGIAKLFGQDFPEIRDKLKSGESLSDDDWKKIIKVGIGIAGAVYFVGAGAGIFTVAWVGGVIAGGAMTASIIELISANKELGDAMTMKIENTEEYQRWLMHQKNREFATIEHLNHQEARLARLDEYLKE